MVYSPSPRSSGHPKKSVINLFKLIDFLNITNSNSIFYMLKKSNSIDNFITKKNPKPKKKFKKKRNPTWIF